MVSRGGPEVRLHVFESGYLVARDVPFVTAAGERLRVSATFADRSYLIEHPEGLLLWDTGLPDELIDCPDGLTMGGWRFVVTRPLLAHLAELRLTPADIDYVGFSHLHLDHAGNAGRFAESIVLVHVRERAVAFGPNPPPAYEPARYAPLRESRAIALEGDYDLFGDGAVLMLEAPGHSAGHQVLLLTSVAGGPVLLSGDLYYAEVDRWQRRYPAWNHDRAATLNAMARIEGLIASTGASIIIHHHRPQSTHPSHLAQST